MSDTASPPASPRPEPARQSPRLPPPDAPAPSDGRGRAQVSNRPKPAGRAPLAPPPARAAQSPAQPLPPPASPADPAAPAAASAALRRLADRRRHDPGPVHAWEVLTYYMAYTDDAYVRSDLVGRGAGSDRARSSGSMSSTTRQIKKGDKLYKIDPVPFQLEVNQRQAQIEEQTALVKVAQEELATAEGGARTRQPRRIPMPSEQQARYAVLAAENNAPRAELDRANNDLRRTAAEMTIAADRDRQGADQHQRAPGGARRRQGRQGDRRVEARAAPTSTRRPTAGSTTSRCASATPRR